MTMLVGVFQMLLSILAVSGLTKVWRPAQAGAALVAARLVPGPLSRRYKTSHLAGRLLGLVEVALAAGGFCVPLMWPDTSATIAVAIGVAGIFAGFNWFITRLTSIDPKAGCGCFGDTSAPPGAIHRTFNAIAVLVALGTAATVGASGDLPTAAASGLGQVVPYIAAIAIGSALFLKGPALAAEVQGAIALDEHSHSQATTFAISQDLLSPTGITTTGITKGRNARGNRS